MHPLVQWLTTLGLIPFVIGAVLIAVGIDSVPWLGSLAPLLTGYAAMIAAFMAGTHWGLAIGGLPAGAPQLLVTSNALALAVWLGHVFLSSSAALIVDACVFAALVGLERRAASQLALQPAYLTLRAVVSAVVIAALLLAAVYI